MTTAEQKTEFLNLMAEYASQSAQLDELAASLVEAWIMRLYDANGANKILDSEAATIGCTAAQLQLGINLMNGEIAMKTTDGTVTASNQFNVFRQNARRLTHTCWWPESDRT